MSHRVGFEQPAQLGKIQSARDTFVHRYTLEPNANMAEP
jgi:hypothetical protein